MREVLGNWLVCAVWNAGSAKNAQRCTFTSDPKGGGAEDGALLDADTGLAMATEHVMATRWSKR